MTEFKTLNLSPILIESLNDAGFIKTSPIQELTLDTILAGKDVFAQAETGSGKTGAFAIPLTEI
jgi:superfamily II DNA/RNA helicase